MPDRRTFENWFDECRARQRDLAVVDAQFAALEQQIDSQWAD
jgi:hypothetical protein